MTDIIEKEGEEGFLDVLLLKLLAEELGQITVTLIRSISRCLFADILHTAIVHLGNRRINEGGTGIGV